MLGCGTWTPKRRKINNYLNCFPVFQPSCPLKGWFRFSDLLISSSWAPSRSKLAPSTSDGKYPDSRPCTCTNLRNWNKTDKPCPWVRLWIDCFSYTATSGRLKNNNRNVGCYRCWLCIRYRIFRLLLQLLRF